VLRTSAPLIGAMDTYSVPGVNHLRTHGRWAFTEFTDVWQMRVDFAARVAAEFHDMIDQFSAARA
jgi:type III restriction enzyme